MKKTIKFFILALIIIGSACSNPDSPASKTASQILGNPEYLAISYGGYRDTARTVQPTIAELKEDMKILHAMGIRILRTYNSQQFDQAANILKAISELKKEEEGFEMYVMLGAWIDCKGAWTDHRIHNEEDLDNNTKEINATVKMAKEYPNIVKVIAVGNEAMIYWADSYFVDPNIILKWVNHLQELKQKGELPSDVWITSSDNYDSWGGFSKRYHTPVLKRLFEAVDYVSLHTYPFHETHYGPDFWGVFGEEEDLSEKKKIEVAMERAVALAQRQYDTVKNYMHQLGIDKPVHIGETGWSSVDHSIMGPNGSKAADEYKAKLYHDLMRDWTNANGISCFYFEAFDEKWKDQNHMDGSENHFGQINLNAEAKYVLWDMVDQGVFEGLTRGGKAITKTYQGNETLLLKDVKLPPKK